eukprot:TRINITY_DN838_c0_g1_i1.p1 TRINITY_DN838_c0_g1~~TRINITY_DN838_c0_g1_i1.p1  ORF type:complete len:989 (+),score=213.84 TRINITY_DN838_c0_g1_i1:385-2967(+)
MAGDKPTVTEVGPYVYREYRDKVDPLFDYEKVTYHPYKRFRFEPNLSDGNESDLITNVNPAYLGVLQKAGSEDKLVHEFTGPILHTIVGKLQGEFVDHLKEDLLPNVLKDLVVTADHQVAAYVNASHAAQTLKKAYDATVANLNTDGDEIAHKVQAAAALLLDPTFEADIPFSIRGVSSFRDGLELVGVEENVPLGILEGRDSTHPGWLTEPETGRGLREFMEIFNEKGAAGVAAAYGINEVGARLLMTYMHDYLFGDIVPNMVLNEPTADVSRRGLLDQWANGTFLIDGLAGSALGFELQNVTRISLSSARLMFDPSNHNSFLNPLGVVNWLDAQHMNQTAVQLMSSFGISKTQFEIVLQWLLRVRDDFVPAALVRQYAPIGVETPDDLAYAQWGSLAILDDRSVKEAMQDMPNVPEFAAFTRSVLHQTPVPLALNVSTARKLLAPSTISLLESANVASFRAEIQAGPPFPVLSVKYGLSENEALAVDQYFAYVQEQFVTPVITRAIKNGGGMFTTRNVTQWLWTYTDPLLTLIAGSSADFHLLTNLTSDEEARKRPADTLNTGAKHLHDIGTYIKWRGDTEVSYWKRPVKVEGSAGGMLGPDPSRSHKYLVWVPDIYRGIHVTYLGTMRHRDMPVYRYVVDPWDLESDSVNPDNSIYFMELRGMLNATSIYKAPLFYSKPHFLDSDPVVFEDVIGVTPASREHHDTFIDVDPITGVTFNSAKRIQLSAHISKTGLFYPKVGKAFVPLMWSSEEGEIGAKSASKYQENVREPIDSKRTITLAFGFSGGFLVLLGVVWFFVAHRRQRLLMHFSDRTMGNQQERQPLFNHRSPSFGPRGPPVGSLGHGVQCCECLLARVYQ